MKPRVVLDTNIFVSILKKGRVRKILDLWLDGEFVLIISEVIIKEIFEVLKRPKFNFSREEIEELGNLIFEKALLTSPQHKTGICPDPDDNKFIECAVGGNADYLVSGDPHLLDLREYQKVIIISPAEFVKHFEI